MAPARAGRPDPPVAVVGEIDGPIGHAEHERSGHEQPGIRARIERRIDRPLGDRHVARGLDEGRIRSVGHGGFVHPEAFDRDPVRRALVGIVPVRAHQEAAAGYLAHRAVAAD
jgi:hypothetical protein